MRRARTLAREAALKTLYQLDLRDDMSRGEWERFLALQGLSDEAAEFARQLVEGTLAHREELDGAIERVARNWTLNRMAAVDRNILRLGTYELLELPELPAAVSINEAVLLAKRYSTKESGSFVNGILDQVRLRRGPGPEPVADAGTGEAGSRGAAAEDAAAPAGDASTSEAAGQDASAHVPTDADARE